MKVIFLDIDGVLNHTLWFQSEERKLVLEDNSRAKWFDPKAVALLNELTDTTEAKIVISSSWREGYPLEELTEILRLQGVTGEIIDQTPSLTFKQITPAPYIVPRGCEIQAWLEQHREQLADRLANAKYVILDDQSDMLLCQQRNFLKIDPWCGLTPTIVEKAKVLLW
ncbi:hypothetical protein BKI52_39195 [marine bacterium AO1-C]|nr:hypothetical protein BKI52_39195 [marine bacterium AO1-C]